MDNLVPKDNETPEKVDSLKDQEAADSDIVKRYKEQITWNKQEAERLRNKVIDLHVEKASVRAESLLELNDEDPKLANEVAKKFWYENFEDAKTRVFDDVPAKAESLQTWLTPDEFERMYTARRNKEQHEEALKKAEKLFWKIKDEWLQEKAKEYFEKITWDKTLSVESAIEFAEMATLYVSKDKLKSKALEDGIVALWSIWLWDSKTTTSKKSEQDYIIRNWQLILKPNKQS